MPMIAFRRSYTYVIACTHAQVLIESGSIDLHR